MKQSIDKVNHSGDAVLDLVHTVMHQLRSLQYRHLRDGPHDITPMDTRVLGFFGRHPGATQSDLAAHSGRDKAQLARLVKGLRDRGLLSATADAADRRNVRLRLTADGEALHASLRQRALQLGGQAVAGFSDGEREQLAALLHRVRANLDDEPPPAV
ncbi:MarR family transcriptional regulator [Xylophilus sp. Kf1]|nr:MarR family transcriptional regulator [Xylophilus sp. Kf1]